MTHHHPAPIAPEMTPARIRALRQMAAEFLELIETAQPDDLEAGMDIALLGGALAGFVPELLDEIERLGAER